MNTRETAWIDIGSVESVPVRGARVVKTAAGSVAVFRTAEDEFYAIDDRCPHKGGPLSQGIVHGASVTCPLHNWVICLQSGAAQGADSGSVKTYRIKVENARMLLDLSALKNRDAA
jgi:nitrite reductase (NADH) small subunit